MEERKMKYKKEELIESIKECKNKYGSVRKKYLNSDDSLPSYQTILNRFNTINNARKKAGIKEREGNCVYSKDELLEIIKEFFSQNPNATSDDFRKVDEYPSQQTFENRFGSWSEAKIEAGIESSFVSCLICERTFDNLSSLSKHLINGHGRRLKSSCINCGELFNRIKKKFCSKECYDEYTIKEKHPCWKENSKKQRIPFGDNWKKQREKTIERDNKKCQRCGISRKQHYEKYGFDIHVDHIKPRIKFYDKENDKLNWKESNKISNLITYCCSCHAIQESKKSN
jgi:5-methylcytosine-specific restriction endonuclease McrA